MILAREKIFMTKGYGFLRERKAQLFKTSILVLKKTKVLAQTKAQAVLKLSCNKQTQINLMFLY